MDETTSNLDSINESKIHQLIKDLSRRKTVLIIAHRLSTIQNADSIYLISEGEVDDCGTHQELYRGISSIKNWLKLSLLIKKRNFLNTSMVNGSI